MGALKQSVEKKGELDAIVATLAVVVTLLILGIIGGGYYLYRRYFTAERFYKHSSIALEPVNEMSPQCSHTYTVNANFRSTDQLPMVVHDSYCVSLFPLHYYHAISNDGTYTFFVLLSFSY